MKSRKSFLFLIVVFCLFTTPLFSQSVNYNKPFAIFMSVITPGMGQVYSGRLDKGLAIWSASTALSLGFLLTVSDLDLSSAGGPFPYNLGLQFKPQLTKNEVFWAVGLGVSFLTVYVYNILDVALYDDIRNFKLSMDPNCISAQYSLAF